MNIWKYHFYSYKHLSISHVYMFLMFSRCWHNNTCQNECSQNTDWQSPCPKSTVISSLLSFILSTKNRPSKQYLYSVLSFCLPISFAFPHSFSYLASILSIGPWPHFDAWCFCCGDRVSTILAAIQKTANDVWHRVTAFNIIEYQWYNKKRWLASRALSAALFAGFCRCCRSCQYSQMAKQPKVTVGGAFWFLESSLSVVPLLFAFTLIFWQMLNVYKWKYIIGISVNPMCYVE